MIREVTAMLARQTFGRKIKHEFDALTAELANTYAGREEEVAQNEISEAIEKSAELKVCRIVK